MDKNRLKYLIYASEVRIVSGIAGIVYNRAAKRDAVRLIRDELDRIPGLNEIERNQLYIFGKNFYRHAIAGAGRKTVPADRCDALYAVLRKDNLRMEELKNTIADEVEMRKKHDYLVDLMNDQDNKFLYCTVLKDCASDHAAFQGKLYYRKGSNFTEEERAYIKKNQLMSVDEVVAHRPWLTIRKNCRHKLIPMSLERFKTGDLGHEFSFHEISYEESRYRFYLDRLKMMVGVKKQFGEYGDGHIPDLLKKDIRDTRRLVLEWRYRAGLNRK